MPPKSKRGKQPADVDACDDADSSESFVTSAELENILKEQLALQTSSLVNEINGLRKELEVTRQFAEDAIKRVEVCETTIDILKSENLVLKEKIDRTQTEKLKNIEELIEDRTNRQLRNTLVIKGVADDRKETWEQTELKLVEEIVKAGIVPKHARTMIERAHRGAPSEDQTGPRPIFARFFSWKDSELVKSAITKLKIQNLTKTMADQKFGPLTTQRRNMALLERKTLKAAGKITKAYIKFPAKLMVKSTNDANERYRCHKDYSKEDVKLKLRT